MSEMCNYKPCEENLCFLKEQIKAQSVKGGFANEEAGAGNGPYWINNEWVIFADNTEQLARKVSCNDIENLTETINSETQQKADNGEFI